MSSAANRKPGDGAWDGGTTGLLTVGFDNAIFRNTASGFEAGYSIDPRDVYGPLVNLEGALSDIGPASHPLANFTLD